MLVHRLVAGPLLLLYIGLTMKNLIGREHSINGELDMINAIAAADIAFIMSSSNSAWLHIPLECSPQKQNG